MSHKSFVPITSDSYLEPEEDQGQLGASESKVIDTKSFRKCHVSTTLNDLVPCQFVDGRSGKKRDACVLFFQFNFGLQKQDSDQRITSMTIDVGVEEGSEAETDFTSSSPELEIKGRYPVSAFGPVEAIQVSTSLGIEVNPSVNNISVIGAKAEVGKSYRLPSKTTLVSSPAGQMGARWQLRENEIHKSGVPAIVNCALALQTDGLPFEIEILFSGQCPLLGVFRMKGKAVMRIGKDLLWLRSPKDDLSVNGLDDIDSTTFKHWVKTKTQNKWAEKIDYEE